MRYLTYSPAAPLAEFVDYLWYLSDAPEHTRERILPSGTLELVINLHEDEFRIYDPMTDHCRRFSGAMVSGAYRGSFVIDTREHASILGVHFKPGGAFPFLGFPVAEVADRHVDLDALWGRSAANLRERLCEATPARRLKILERALLTRLSQDVQKHGAVKVALDHLGVGDETVTDIAARVDLSHRRFIQVFAAEVGMTPKVFERVRRFQRALAHAHASDSPDWAGLSVMCGYYDQSHLIREFLAFSGLSPAEYLRHRNEDVKENHIALPSTTGSSSSNTPAPERSIVRANGAGDGSVSKS